MRVLYLFSGIRGGLVEKVKRGEDPGDGTWGMVRLPHFGIEAEHLELEHVLPDSAAKFIRRKVLGNYGAHIPFFFHFFRYDIIFTAGAFYSQLLFTLAQIIFRFKKPLWVMHDFNITGFLGNGTTIKQKLFRFITLRAGGIVTVGKEESERLKKLLPHLKERIEYIPFGVDISFFSPREGKEVERRILSVGVDPDRDWETLFNACEGLGVEVVAATRPRGSRDVTPPPFVTRKLFPLKELVDEYVRASIVVLPLDSSAGVNDAMGATALFEAMAMGKAIIATSTHTMRSYITHGENGLLVEEGNVEEMYSAIKKLLDDKELRDRLGHAARAYAVQNLDAEKLAGTLVNYFKKLVAEAH
ncbi:hypothetical protein A2673_00125 [Candidatus Kaiserbacteria bacterium RIFCSPHIGHO2_01_FULL_50_13]|uniref:Glycosyl transferase family 1 domain-containing protein n=1 Tax=Candidatus Kaiserbacteria bacterium RIFCSPLOWO2_01_FULL_50_24 TaxID=1798507 RepID=A0A1F6EIX6_9BACT|nr:MAG: hypothetical protein A2673_00125 [Candidatus Kaiserbacteria bacterium RIFCSPHIGHO2_01_FULL_50_13]OGG73590.1 MAG: hypothetical protein A3A34_02860 [Candidatus Kaiserbacteria bacterium RIFCSPLOWO2_01_FULL_50_24]OGG81253.1 MAG: hypothetical protein A3H74_03720 [Candidatus Kaiserbacteria bacterium RIFCSPLOWO2_02_FULL_51_13]